jgi:hypothetical protein
MTLFWRHPTPKEGASRQIFVPGIASIPELSNDACNRHAIRALEYKSEDNGHLVVFLGMPPPYSITELCKL